MCETLGSSQTFVIIYSSGKRKYSDIYCVCVLITVFQSS